MLNERIGNDVLQSQTDKYQTEQRAKKEIRRVLIYVDELLFFPHERIPGKFLKRIQ